MSEAGRLANLWARATEAAPFSYSVSPDAFASGLIANPDDDESFASSRDHQLVVAVDGVDPLGFAQLNVGTDVEVDGEDIVCGVIRFLAFLPERQDAGQLLLETSHQYFLSLGLEHIDAFPLYHGYAFHNYKVGTLSDRLRHITDLLTRNGYQPHDAHLTFDRDLEMTKLPPPHPDIDVDVDVVKNAGEGPFPDIRVKAMVDGVQKGVCRSMTGWRYAAHEPLDRCCYTRGLQVQEPFRRRGIGRYLLRRARYEMQAEGYTHTRLNCRENNPNALALYRSEGYRLGDRSCAYVKDLGA